MPLTTKIKINQYIRGPSKGFSWGSQQRPQVIEIWSKRNYNPYLKRNWCALVKYLKNLIYALKVNKIKFFIIRGLFLRFPRHFETIRDPLFEKCRKRGGRRSGYVYSR
jgi:hypothetical protein